MGDKVELEILSVKSLREDLCVVQSALNHYPSGDQTSRVRRIGELINQLDEMRPLGPDGKHGNRHTDKCGCEDQDTVQLVDVNSLFPEAITIDRQLYENKVIDFVRIPEFRDYEVNRDGVVRNFWTKREIHPDSPTDESIKLELHRKDGTPVNVALWTIMKATFGE